MIAMPRGPFGSNSNPKVSKILRVAKDKVSTSKSDPARPKPKVFDSIEHLSPEAIAGYVDEELPPAAMNRARIHLVHCAECRAEVIAQRGASDRLRQSSEEDISAPSSLVAKLASIAQSCPEGPEVEDVPKSRGEDFTARIETFYRAVKKAQGK